MTALPISGPGARRAARLEVRRGRRRPAIMALGAGALALASCGGVPDHPSAGHRVTSGGGATPSAPSQPQSLPPGAAVIPAGPIVALGPWSGVEPSTISVSSGGGSSVTGITWSVWDDRRATGTGLWVPRHCAPACSGGSPGHVATVTLSDVAHGRYTKLVEHSGGPQGTTTSYTLPDGALSASNGS